MTTVILIEDEAVSIRAESDIVTIRKRARNISKSLGFGFTDVTRIVTAASELARNIYRFAETGTVIFKIVKNESKKGIELIFEDQGPGIADIDQAMKRGFTTQGGMGMGLPGSKRLMDELEIRSEVNKGTQVIIRKWLKR